MCLNCDLSLFFSVLLRSSTNAIVNPSKVKQVSSKSRAFVYEGFLTELGCDHMVSLVIFFFPFIFFAWFGNF
ncbi:hypothetical protein YC2023_061289 [Brassica napus]